MLELHTGEKNCNSAETDGPSIPTGKIKENTQVTVKDTGWTEEEKERMKQFGYDGLDIIRAWYD